jgi:hypothetical protein
MTKLKDSKTIIAAAAMKAAAAAETTKTARKARATQRRFFNKVGKQRIMTGIAVFTDLRKNVLKLSNRPTIDSINKNNVVEELKAYCGFDFQGKSIHTERLPKLLKSLNTIQQFMTDSQRLKFLSDNESCTHTFIVDVIVKAAAMKVQNYELCLQATLKDFETLKSEKAARAITRAKKVLAAAKVLEDSKKAELTNK